MSGENAPTRWWQTPSARRLAILLGLWAAIGVCLYAVRAILLPFVGAFLLAYVIEPVIQWVTRQRIRRFRLPRFAAVLLLYLGLFGVLYLFGLVAIPRAYRETQRLSRAAQTALSRVDDQTVAAHARRLQAWLVAHDLALAPPAEPTETPQAPVPPLCRIPPATPGGEPSFRVPTLLPGGNGAAHLGLRLDLTDLVQSAVKRAAEAVRAGLFQVVAVAQRIAGAVIEALFYFGLLLMLTAFISIDTRRVMRVLRSLVPVRYQADAETLMARIDTGLSGVVRGQLTIMLINGALTFVGLWIFGVRYTVLLGLMATVFYLVPIFGTILSSIPIVLVALADSPSKALVILLWLVGVHLLESYYLNPKILGDAAKIHPVLIVFALLAGEHLGGIVGALLAVPAMSVALAIFRFAHRRAVELGELPPMQAEESKG